MKKFCENKQKIFSIKNICLYRIFLVIYSKVMYNIYKFISVYSINVFQNFM